MTTFFVDVSHHDRDRRGAPLRWDLIAAAGLPKVMIARASYGDPQTFSPTTRYFAEFISGARANGYAARGGYHNLIHSPDQAGINRQVDFLRRELDAAGATFGMADVEPYPELRTNGLWPRWDDVRRFHDRWWSIEPRQMVWYIGRWVWRDWLGQPDLRLLHGMLINANYPGGDGTPQQIYLASGGDTGPGWSAYGGRTAEIWQFTSTGDVNGASSRTDCNAYRGPVDILVSKLNAAGGGAPIPGGDMPLEDADVKKIWNELVTDDTDERAAGRALWVARQHAKAANDRLSGAAPIPAVVELEAKVDGLAADLAEIKALLVAGGGGATGPVDLSAAAITEIRDAVADLGEGGAGAVRADAE